MVISSASALRRCRLLKPPVQAIYAKGHVIPVARREPQESDSTPTLFHHAHLICRETMEFATMPPDKAEP
jgi:hypothetical protein